LVPTNNEKRKSLFGRLSEPKNASYVVTGSMKFFRL
jgi:hypothetical protein